MQFLYYDYEQQAYVGPISVETLKELAKNGTIVPKNEIIVVGTNKTYKAANIKGLEFRPPRRYPCPYCKNNVEIPFGLRASRNYDGGFSDELTCPSCFQIFYWDTYNDRIVKADTFDRKTRRSYISDTREDKKEQYDNVVEDARDFAKKYQASATLYGFFLDFNRHATYVCPYREQLEKLVFYADMQPADLIKHLPPYRLCPTNCDYCELQNAELANDFEDRVIAVWPDMKRKEKPPKYMRTENNPADEPFPTKTRDITEILEL